MSSSQLDSRYKSILWQTIHTFIAYGEPVGSRTLSKQSPQGLSPATIRNIMADLEDLGYLEQPHPSSGRVPTDKGYRLYVSSLRSLSSLGSLMSGAALTRTEQEMIGTSFKGAEGDVASLVENTSSLLARLTHMVSFVTGPEFQRSTLRQVEFIRLSPTRLLVVLVTQAGQAFNRFIETPQTFSGEELQECARYLEAEFRGFTLLEAREAISLRVREMRAIYNRLTKNAVTLGRAAFSEDMGQPGFHLNGTARVLSMPEFRTDMERASKLLDTLEQKDRLVSILDACLLDGSPQIVIGSEAPVPDFEGLSLIAARYHYKNRELGSVGIMGPSRMEYARFISVVDYLARSLSAAISRAADRRAH